jgi:hypothetical protein
VSLRNTGLYLSLSENPVFTTLHLTSPVHVAPPLVSFNIIHAIFVAFDRYSLLLTDTFDVVFVFAFPSESIATLTPFGPIERQKWFDQISSQ